MKVYKVHPQYIDFLKTVLGTEGSRLNLDVQDIDGNIIVGQEEWNSHEFQWLKNQYPTETKEFILIKYKPKPIENPFIKKVQK